MNITEDFRVDKWCQGDYSLDVGGFIYATLSDDDSDCVVDEEVQSIRGLVVISQSCDIAQHKPERQFVAVCPLIEVNEKLFLESEKGMRPYFVTIENYEPNAVADLRRVMSVHKKLLTSWEHNTGFSSESGRVKFAAALERKFGQFAFPDQFNRAIAPFRNQIRKRHNKSDSVIGKIYRSLLEIRFRATPSWESDHCLISVIAIQDPNKSEFVTRKEVNNELTKTLAKIIWPDGFEWASPHYLTGFPNDITADLIFPGRRGDLTIFRFETSWLKCLQSYFPEGTYMPTSLVVMFIRRTVL